VDRYLILLLAGQTALGIYSPATTALGVCSAVLGTIGVLLLPVLSEKYGGPDRNTMKEVSRLFSRYIFLVYIPFAIGAAVLAYPIIDLFVGNRFLGGALPLAILVLASALTCGSVVVNNMLLAMGRTRVFAVVSLLSVVADVALSFLLIGVFGAVGAAIARAATIFISFGLPALALIGLHSLSLDSNAFTKSLAASSIMALVVLTTQLVYLSELMLPFYIVIGGLAYLLGLKALKVLREEDFILAETLVPGKMRKAVDLVRRFTT
jgi:O-antigen/teichoic acid export membrane protein